MQKNIRFLVLLLLLPILTGCASRQSPAQTVEAELPTPSPTPTPAPVRFAAAVVPGDTEELCLVLEPGETALLDSLPALRRVDASGSECREELCAWGLAHPEVELCYTVPVPGLGLVENGTERLDLTALRPEQIEEAAEALRLLPKLQELQLAAGEEGLSLEEAYQKADELDEAAFSSENLTTTFQRTTDGKAKAMIVPIGAPPKFFLRVKVK